MKITDFYRIVLIATTLSVSCVLPSVAAESPQNRVDYWLKTYGELKPENDPRAAKAHEIFSHVLDAAGKKSGVVPRLLIINHNSLIASAIPDGGIIISKKVLDICYQNPQRGDDRLAFVLAHEIAHQLKDDFWHMKFFQAIELSKEKSPEQKKALEEVEAIAGSTEKVLAKELQADEYGIIYASMAGYNTNAVVTEDDKVNFFEDWVTALDPARVPGIHQDPTHPSPKQRAETVKAQLRQVLEKVDIFRMGLLFYQAEEYQKARLAFEKFLQFFPSREVYHNLAACHHQIALKYYRDWKGEKEALGFKLSIAVDPQTRASKITLKGGQDDPAALFNSHMNKAIEYYQKAISLDPFYSLSYNNLGCALILKEDAYKAVAMLRDAIKINPNSAETLNNLGVAFFYTENSAKAKENLAKAHDLDTTYDAPLFNLGKIAQEEKNTADAKKYWTAYLKLDSAGPWADFIRTALSLEKPKEIMTTSLEKKTENIFGLETGASGKEISLSWGKPAAASAIPLEEEPFNTALYSNGVMTVSQDDEVLMIVTPEKYKGRSSRGIAVGSPLKEVLTSYGAPTKVLNMTQGASWVYRSEKIAFRIRDGKVVSWLLF